MTEDRHAQPQSLHISSEQQSTHQQPSASELISRLELMEGMMEAGRQGTCNSGWIFVLWGLADVVAILWSARVSSWLPWPITMTTAWILTIVGSRWVQRDGANTAMGRAVSAIWLGLGIAMGLFCFSVAISRHFEPHSFQAAVAALLGAANFSSAIILRWKVQFAVAFMWWGSAISICFAPVSQVTSIFVGALLLGNVVFGLYLMYLEHRGRQLNLRHA